MAFERHARNVSLLTIVSRFAGLARDAVMSRAFGAGSIADAFYFAFLVPNLFRRLFGEGALAAALIPSYTQLEARDPAMARALALMTISRLVTVLGGIALIGELVLLAIVMARGASPPLTLLMIMLPYMPLVCLVAILGAMLQVHGRFGPAAAAPIILNGCIIAAAAGGPPLLGVDAGGVGHAVCAASSVVVAGLLQVAWAAAALRGRLGAPAEASARDEFRGVLRRALPMILGLGVLQLNTLFDGLIASYPMYSETLFGLDYPLDKGAMTTINYAQRLYQFPLGVFGIAVATAIFPLLARLAGDADAFSDTVRRGVRLVLFIGVPASVGLMLVREPLARVILEGRAFQAEDTSRVARVLLGYAPAVWAYSMTHVLTRAFFALDDSKTPVKVAMGMVSLNLLLNVTLIWTPLREAGLAWSTSICAAIQGVVLLGLLRRRGVVAVDRDTLRTLVRIVIATGLMVGAVLVARGMAPPDGGWLTAAGSLAAQVLAGGFAYAALAGSMRMKELGWALGRRS